VHNLWAFYEQPAFKAAREKLSRNAYFPTQNFSTIKKPAMMLIFIGFFELMELCTSSINH